MRTNFNHIEKNHKRIKHPIHNIYGDDQNGAFIIKSKLDNSFIRVIVSSNNGWDHVSVSKSNSKTPTWEEMCFIKDLFFRKDETVIQFHPKKSEYVNIHNNCLHLWRDQNQEYELPNNVMV